MLMNPDVPLYFKIVIKLWLLVIFCRQNSDMSPSGSSKGGNKTSGLNQQYEEKVRPCIDLVDSLRSLGVEKDLNLPAIAVIGDQSSGKSSVLEALSGVALPRGTGTHPKD